MTTNATPFKPGDFVRELLVTDTITYEVVGVTEKTIQIRRTSDGETVKTENRDGNPYPCVWTGQVSDPTAPVRTVRLRKDGTYRTGQGGNPLKPATLIDGVPVRYTDYRF